MSLGLSLLTRVSQRLPPCPGSCEPKPKHLQFCSERNAKYCVVLGEETPALGFGLALFSGEVLLGSLRVSKRILLFPEPVGEHKQATIPPLPHGEGGQASHHPILLPSPTLSDRGSSSKGDQKSRRCN